MEPEPESDADVIGASLAEPSAFGRLFDRHATVVFRYLVRRVGVDDAEVLLGDVFRVAFEKRENYDRERPNARPWLYGIATNLLAHHRRSEARRIAATARLLTTHRPADDQTDRVVARLDAVELWPHIAEAVGLLPDRERDVVLLYVWEELTYDEIREARTESEESMLAWLRVGDGVVMIGHANAEIHRIHSPRVLGNTTVQMMVYVRDVDAHDERAVAEGAEITMELQDAFYGERRYEATDLEGHRWHFGERHADIKARGGSCPRMRKAASRSRSCHGSTMNVVTKID